MRVTDKFQRPTPFLLVVCAVLLAGCGGGGGDTATTVAEPDSEVAALYKAKCAVCHGGAGANKPMIQGARNLTDPDWKAQADLDEVIRFVSEGKGIMPKFSAILTDEEIRAVSEYVLK